MSREGGPLLVCGAGGFVGTHLVDHLGELGSELVTPTRAEVDLTEAASVRDLIDRVRPSVAFHLAGQASVKRSWDDPQETLLGNLGMTANLLEAVRVRSPSTRVILISSGEIYGAPSNGPLTEGAPLGPASPYAVSKAACDLLGAQYAEAHRLSVVRLRPFNHCGPGQSDTYLVGSLTRQVAAAELTGATELTLHLGNIESARDFTDVRDIAGAYAAAIGLERGAYNVSSQRSVRVRDLITELGLCTDLELHIEVDASRLRPADPVEIRGDSHRFRKATGWSPQISLRVTLGDAIAEWKTRLIQR